MDAKNFLNDKERVNYEKCIENAKKYGFTEVQADECEEENPLCLNCPFIKPKKRKGA